MDKQLYAVKHDSGNCRLYVKDQEGKRYVLIDQGHTHAKWGLPRFELHTHSADGQPEVPIKCDWELLEGVTGTEFESGLSYETAVRNHPGSSPSFE